MMLATHRDKYFRSLSQRFRSCRGMTLVELMVVTAIFGVVIGAIYSLILPVQKSTFTQTNVVDMQDSMRLALDQITQDVRHAGLMVEGDPVDNNTVTAFTIRLRTPPQALGGRIVNYAYTPPVDYTNNLRSADILEPVGSTFRFDPPAMTARFADRALVKIVDAVEKRVIHSDVTVRITDVAGNDGNVNDPTRFNENTITFELSPEELEALAPDKKVLYVMPVEWAAPDVRTVTYIFNPNDNTLPGGARPTLRRFEGWPQPIAGTNDVNPIVTPPPNCGGLSVEVPDPSGGTVRCSQRLLLGGDPPVAGDNFRKTFDAQFAYDKDTLQFTIDITGRTEAYDRNLRQDVAEDETRIRSAGAKPRRLLSSVSLRNAIHTY